MAKNEVINHLDEILKGLDKIEEKLVEERKNYSEEYLQNSTSEFMNIMTTLSSIDECIGKYSLDKSQINSVNKQSYSKKSYSYRLSY
jgi:predicted AAA+ superfamily ATPase